MASRAPYMRHEKAIQFARMCRRALLAVGYRADELNLTRIPDQVREGEAVEGYDHLKPLKVTIFEPVPEHGMNGAENSCVPSDPPRPEFKTNGMSSSVSKGSGEDTETDEDECHAESNQRLFSLCEEELEPLLTVHGLRGVTVVTPGEIAMCKVCGMRFAPLRCACVPYGRPEKPDRGRHTIRKSRRSSHSSTRRERR